MKKSGNGQYSLRYHYKVPNEDLPVIDPLWQKRIRQAIEEKLFKAPNLYGKHLRGPLGDLGKLRVGDYRIIFLLRSTLITILIVGNRRDVYQRILSRLNSA